MDIDFAMFRQMAENSENNRNVAAHFYDKAVKTDKTTENGLPIFKNVTYVEIRLKDNNTEVFNQPATAEKIRRFPQEYSLYQQIKKQAEQGTPLEQFAFLSAAEIETCRSRGVATVETLAALDADKTRDLGLEQEQHLASLFLQKAKEANDVAVFARKEGEYLRQIEKLEEENNKLKQDITELSKTKTLNRKKTKKGGYYENNTGNMSGSGRFGGGQTSE